MCGIVGLLLKQPALRPRLGELMVPMLIGMTERGPDSSGMAVFTESVAGDLRKFSLYCAQPGFDWRLLEIGLVISSVTLLTRSRIYWYFGIGASIIGVSSVVWGFLIK